MAGSSSIYRRALEIFGALSRIDGSVGWTAMIGGGHGMFAPLLPRDTYEQVYQNGPDVIIAGSAQPTGAAEAVAGGWRVNGIVTLQSGAPFTVNLGTDRANIGSGPAQRPDAICDPNAGAPHTPEQWFNMSCFALPPLYSFGNSGRNTVVAPGYADIDVALDKEVALSGEARLEFRWEIFNLLDRANFDVPNRIAFTPNVGRIFSAGPARQMQFGIKLAF